MIKCSKNRDNLLIFTGCAGEASLVSTKSKDVCFLAAIAQLVERIHGKDEVRGSNPRRGSKLSTCFLFSQSGVDDQILIIVVSDMAKDAATRYKA